MSKSHSTINEKSSQWQSGLPSNLPVKTSDVLGYDLDEDMTEEDGQTKVKTVGENQSSSGKTERKQQSNFVENRKEKGDDAFEHESHDFHKHSCPSHFTGEKSELEIKDDEATMELKKGHSNPSSEGKEHDEKMEKPKEVSFINPKYDKSAENDHKKESDEKLENENLPKTKAVKRHDDQLKTQQSNSSSSSSSDDSDHENNSNDRKGTNKTKLKNNLVQGGNTGDTDASADRDMGSSKTDKSGFKKAESDSDVKDSDASEEKTTFKNPKSANAGQRQQQDKRDAPDNEPKNHQKNENKNEEEKEIESDAERNDDANDEHETLGDRVRNTGVEVDASKANTFGPKDFGFLKDDKNEDNDDPKKFADMGKQRNNESSSQDNNDKVSRKDEEDKNSMKQWIENLVTNDTPKSDDTSNETMDGKKCREFHNKK